MPIAIGDIIDAPIRLRLSTRIGSSLRALARIEQRARQLGAPIFTIHIIVGVRELAPRDVVAHRLAVSDGIDESIGHVPISLRRAGQVLERQSVPVRGGLGSRRGRRRALGAVEPLGEEFQEPADPPNQSKDLRVPLGMITEVPTRLRIGPPRRKRRIPMRPLAKVHAAQQPRDRT